MRDRGDSFGSGIKPSTLNTIQCVHRQFSRKMQQCTQWHSYKQINAQCVLLTNHRAGDDL